MMRRIIFRMYCVYRLTIQLLFLMGAAVNMTQKLLLIKKNRCRYKLENFMRLIANHRATYISRNVSCEMKKWISSCKRQRNLVSRKSRPSFRNTAIFSFQQKNNKNVSSAGKKLLFMPVNNAAEIFCLD